MIFSDKRASAILLMFAFGCGDGTDVHLGSARPVQPVPEGGVGDAGADRTPDSTATCDGAARVDPQLTALLADCAGSGCGAFGGRDGCLYEVTHDGDDGPGSLRAGLALEEPAWIRFRGDFDIVLERHLEPRSDKTIDARERAVTLRDYGIRLENVANVVIENVKFLGRLDLESDAGVDQDDLDAVSLVGPGTHDIWIDHCSFVSYPDGLIDISGGATRVTISYSHFSDHKYVMLFGPSVEDTAAAALRATLHHNWFERTTSYHPRIRYGWVHLYNNLLDQWGDFGVRAVQNSRLYTEKNVYLAGGDPTAVTLTRTDDDTSDGFVRAIGDDLLLNGAELAANDDGTQVAAPDYAYVPAAADPGGLLEQSLRTGAGVRLP